ncbi:hypothetical protein BJX99DRAFT_62044 [Aspergillus californicus]
MTTNVLVTGATGFIGGSVLAQILSAENPKAKDVAVTALVREKQQAAILAAKGVNAMLFNGLDDTAHLRTIASEFDIVIHCATGLHTTSAEALILGLGDSMKRSGRQTHYIHTTGTSNLAYSIISHPDAPVSTFADTDDVYEEEVRRDAQQLYHQRRTDLVVIATAEQTGVKPYLMMPPTVYGEGLGLFKTQSIQLPFVIGRAIEAGYPEYIGDGSGTVGFVHISDLAMLYVLLLNRVLDVDKGVDVDVPSGRKGYYFSNTGDFTWKSLSYKIGEVGLRLGALTSSLPKSITLSEAVQRWNFRGFDGLLIETNFAGRSKTSPKKAYSLGWQPVKEEEDWNREIENTWKAILARAR